MSGNDDTPASSRHGEGATSGPARHAPASGVPALRLDRRHVDAGVRRLDVPRLLLGGGARRTPPGAHRLSVLEAARWLIGPKRKLRLSGRDASCGT